jgi:hypothetical protein
MFLVAPPNCSCSRAEGDLLQLRADVARHLAGGAAVGVGGDLDLAQHGAAVDLVGAGALAQAGHLVQAHDARRAVGIQAGGERQALEVAGRAAQLGRQAHHHVVGLVVGRAPVAHRGAGQQGAQRGGDLRRGQAQLGGGLALDDDVQRGLVGLAAGVQVDQAGDGAQALHQRRGQALQLGLVGPLQRELDLLLPAHRLQQAGLGDGDARHLAQALAQLGRQRLGAARALLRSVRRM